MTKRHSDDETFPDNFIHDIIDDDLETGRRDEVVTRFPPEPNGYLHVGHATSIVLNFETARKYGGRCHLRFDDTNPLTEETEYVESIKRDVQWLGYDWGEHLYFASDYFEFMYECAIVLIKKGKAYVDSLDMETIREYRGSWNEPGKDSPYRDRSVDENLDLFRRMRAGEFDDGEHVLRAKIDMSASNMIMRDPLLYRIRHATHHNTGDDWCIYPMYDFAHCLEDSYENITHSLCTLEFENNREIYDWLIEETEVDHQPQQIEFARRNLSHTITSKRRLRRMVEEGIVDGWDDPRLPTLSALRRRGVPPSAIRRYCRRIGVSKSENRVEYSQFEDAIRDDLNTTAPRVLGVVDPVKVVLTNYPEGEREQIEVPHFPEEIDRDESRNVPFGRELYIDRDDFREDPPSGWYRLAVGEEVRLRHAYNITCNEVVKDGDEIVELRCQYHPETEHERSPDGRTVEGTLHWVSADRGVECTVRLYERLFDHPNPNGDPDVDFVEHLNDDSLVEKPAVVEPSILDDDDDQRYQFERRGFFWRDPVDSTNGDLVFNRIVSLRDRWAQKQKEKKKREDERRRKEKQRRREKARKAQKEAGPSDPVSEQRRRARRENPELAEKFDAYQTEFDLSKGDADLLAGSEETAAFFDAALDHYDSPDSVAPWLINEVMARLDEGETVADLAIRPEQVASIVEMIDDDRITAQATVEILDDLLETGDDPEKIVDRKGLEKVGDVSKLEPMVDEVIDDHPDEVERYRGGNDRLIGFFIGQIMQKTQGSADAQKVRELFIEKLASE